MRRRNLRDDGSLSHLTMTRKEFFALHTDYRNKPGRTDAPTCTAAEEPTHGGHTVLVQVVFVCPHDVLEKIRCEACATTKRLKAQERRRAMADAAASVGMRRVRGNLGGTYWE